MAHSATQFPGVRLRTAQPDSPLDRPFMPPMSSNGGGPAAACGPPLAPASGRAAPLAAAPEAAGLAEAEAAAGAPEAPLGGGPAGWLAKNWLTSCTVLPGASLATAIWCSWGPLFVTFTMVVPAGRLLGMSKVKSDMVMLAAAWGDAAAEAEAAGALTVSAFTMPCRKCGIPSG